jgi:pimeloyl-ACP methyl ester carboxylesterase
MNTNHAAGAPTARDGQPSPTDTDARSARGYQEHHVPRGPHRLYARDYPGAEPAILLLHGFPDNLHLYDRLVPQLAPRRVVVFDFLGWGASDKPAGYQYTATNQVGDLDAAIDQLQLTSVVLVAHDASVAAQHLSQAGLGPVAGQLRAPHMVRGSGQDAHRRRRERR